MNVQDKLRAGLPVTARDVLPPRLGDHVKPGTPEEARSWATALAVAHVNRRLRRVVRKLDARIDAVAAREAARRRFGPRR